MIKFYCQHCEQKLSAPSELAGTEIECPRCKNDTLIPPEKESVYLLKALALVLVHLLNY